MGLSHLSMLKPHPDVAVAGICDSTRYVLDVLHRYSGVPTYTDYARMLDEAGLDAVVIATPSHLHAPMVEAALERNVHVFCEKPLFLDTRDGTRLTALARERDLVTQVGYHNRFVASFAEVKRLLEANAIGTPVHALAEAYGPVVLKPQRRSWRSRAAEGGGALYDYAAHPLDLLTWYLGVPSAVDGRVGHAFSRDADDTVAATVRFGQANAMLSVNWSDESQRKMTTKITIWGTHGRICADRQEIQVYRRVGASPVDGYDTGWNVRYTTDLTETPWFYVRGEEYSAQIDNFVHRVRHHEVDGVNTFTSAGVTDRLISMIADRAKESGRDAGRPTPDVGTLNGSIGDAINGAQAPTRPTVGSILARASVGVGRSSVGRVLRPRYARTGKADQ